MLRLNIGCGGSLMEGYTNVDLYVAHPAVLNASADSLPYPDNSVDEVFSSHLLEHISHLQTEKVLAEWFRVLRPGGMLQLVVPDLEWCLRNWLALPESQRWGFPLCTLFGLQTHPGEYHYTGFTVPRLTQLLQAVGFASVAAESRYDPVHIQNSIWASALKGAAGAAAPGHAVSGRTMKFGGKVYRFIGK